MNEILKNLEIYYRQHQLSHRAFEIKHLTSLTSGWENEMYAFDLEYALENTQRKEELVLRIYPGLDAQTKSASEFQNLKLLQHNNYPVPRVFFLEQDRSFFKKPFVVMERIKGELLGKLLFHSENPDEKKILALFCKLFVQLHQLDWQPFVESEKHAQYRQPYYFVDEWLHLARSYLSKQELNEFLPVVDWLEQRHDRVPCSQPSVVHQDFHPFNILVRIDGTASVIDWGSSRVSDARFDLAWTMMLASAYHGVEWREKILREYQDIAPTELKEIEYFEVCAYVSRLFDIIVSLTEGPEKRGMRPEAIAMIKQEMGAAKRVYDFLVNRTKIKLDGAERIISEYI